VLGRAWDGVQVGVAAQRVDQQVVAYRLGSARQLDLPLFGVDAGHAVDGQPDAGALQEVV
jgi:hypothetical protein